MKLVPIKVNQETYLINRDKILFIEPQRGYHPARIIFTYELQLNPDEQDINKLADILNDSE